MTTNRRCVLRFLSWGFALASSASALFAADMFVFIGTYTGEGSEGIYRAPFDSATGALGPAELAAAANHPSFLALSADRQRLYAVAERGEGQVRAYAVDPASGALSLINQQSTGGRGPCHVAVDPGRRHVAVAHYGSGSVALFPLSEDGALLPRSALAEHSGSGPNAQRQERAHAHSVYFSADGSRLLAVDLGIDQVKLYRIGSGSSLEPNQPPFAALPPGSGPRHLAFHSSGRVVYAVNELTNTVSVLACDPLTGAMEQIQMVDTLPADHRSGTTAEVAVHPHGRFLYVSNRGHDSLALFSIDAVSGRLQPQGHHSTGGRTPRHFAIDPSGRWLLAANQDSASVVVFSIDADSGRLVRAGELSNSPTKPVCIVFLPR
jgi:6-phosphogluconolactonase